MPTPLQNFISKGLSQATIQPNRATGQWSGGGAASGGNPTAAIDAAQSMGITSFQFPDDLPKYYMTIMISTYSRQNLRTVGSLDRKGLIRLPLPLNLNDFHTEEWREYEYGMIAGVLSDVVGLNTRLGQFATAVGGPLAVGALQTLFESGFGLESGAASGASLAGRWMRGAEGLAGWAPNMFNTVLYRGPRFKQPKFIFKLAPRTYSESAAIRAIINALHTAMSPSMTAANVLFDFPDIFEIAFMPNSGWLYKFKPAALEMIHVNYAGGGRVAFYKGGEASDGIGSNNPPESVEIELHFKELEYWTKSNFQAVPNNNTTSGANPESSSLGQRLTNWATTSTTSPFSPNFDWFTPGSTGTPAARGAGGGTR